MKQKRQSGWLSGMNKSRRRDGRDESDLIKFLRAESLKMIRREVREVQEDSEGGGGGWGVRRNWPRMHKCEKCAGT